jgi:hypothetical protein
VRREEGRLRLCQENSEGEGETRNNANVSDPVADRVDDGRSREQIARTGAAEDEGEEGDISGEAEREDRV